MNWVSFLLELLAAALVALATAYFSSRFYAHRAKADLRKEFQSRFNERKWDTYTQFADIVRQVIESGKKDRVQRDLPKVIARLYGFTSSLWLVGSDEVVEAFLEWQRYSRSIEDGKPKGIEPLSKLTDILIEMRKDLGYDSSKLQSIDLLATFITDIDNYRS